MGTGVGAAGAGTVGTVIGGVVGGPVGAVVGAVVGGLAGKSTAERINPTSEDNYWRDNYNSRPYVEKGAVYEDYQFLQAHCGGAPIGVLKKYIQNQNSYLRERI